MPLSREVEVTDGALVVRGDDTRALGRGARRERPLAAGAIALFLAANGAVIVWMWLKGGGISGVHGRPEAFTSLGRITGLLAVYLALLQILMLARLPALERLVGFDKLTVWHRFNGKLCVSLVIAHVFLITAGYSLADRISFGGEFSRLLNVYPEMVTATIGTVLMVTVVATSIVIARRRLRYEAWYFVHVTVYAGIALAYLHQIPTGNEFAAHPVQADYWIALYAATLAVLIAFRVLRPAVRAYRHRLRVSAVTVEARGVTSIEVSGRELDRLGVHAGQFMLWRFLTPGRWWQSHPFSLSALPDGRTLRLTVKDVGDFSGALKSLPVGTKVLAEGPFGAFTSDALVGDRVALIAGGIGITPLRALFEELSQSHDVALVYRAISKKEVVLERELREIAERPGAEFHLILGDHRKAAGAQLLEAKALAKLIPDIARRDVYVCGPAGMMDATLDALRQLGVPEDQVHLERFALAA
jgi:predicted ferric reductase